MLSSAVLGVLLISTVAFGALEPVVLINAGYQITQGTYEDTQGRVWSPDPIPNGDPSNNGWRHIQDPDTDIIGTEDDELYRYNRYKLKQDGPLVYNITVPNGSYTIQLLFAELRKTEVDQRVFDIVMQGFLVTPEYDCFEEAGGADTAVMLEFESVAVTHGTLTIEFQPVTGHAMISAIGVFLDNTPAVSPTSNPAMDTYSYQPRIINVEAFPAHKAQGFIGFPGGSEWCQGRATYWWTGHDNRPEEPFCEEADGSWTKSSSALLDRQDELNILDGPTFIDRHDCVAFDGNGDGVADIICVVGANKGTGLGWTEVYYTQPNGSIVRELDDIGLYKYPTMRTRYIKNLTAADGGNMVVIATTGGPRADGQPNDHRMFRLNATFGFDEVTGPFVNDFQASCLEVCDMNSDGIDDIIICDNIGRSRGYTQNPDGTWTEVDWSGVAEESLEAWNGARVADVTGDGLADLVLAGPAFAWLNRNPDPYIRVYPGTETLPTIFDFDNPVIDDALPFEAMDVEVIDINDDELLDIYVVLWNYTDGQGDYCQQTWNYNDWWTGNHDFPPSDFVPPSDAAPDFLYLSIDGASWNAIQLEHSVPGCGSAVKKWGQKSLAVAHGSLSRPGFNVILDWSPPPMTSSPSVSQTPTLSTVPTTTPNPTNTATEEPTSTSDLYQPLVINVEAFPAHKAMGFIGRPDGSIWCQGRPTYWWTGHDNRPEEPFCEEADGTWTKSSTAVLDRQDDLNILDGPTFIDRHDCAVIDANSDGIEDIVCVVGANKGTGNGWTEVYYTQPNGTIVRQMQDVGLYKYPTMRTRLIQNLNAASGEKMLMIATTGGPRPDGQSNDHRMFRLNSTNGFDEVMGPFNIDHGATCLEICDINNDGVDDVIICNEDGPATAYIQSYDGTWSELDWSGLDEDIVVGWNGVRVADVTGDGLTDLLVAGAVRSWLVVTPDPYFRVFPGTSALSSAFDFDNPVIEDVLPYQAMDVEVIDLNDDGLLDMYVVQRNTTSGQGDYCQKSWHHTDWWEGNHDFPPIDFVPPLDVAPDSLYLSIDGASWTTITMEHSIPGCGNKAKKWTERSLAVAHGSLSRPGFNVILDWS